jgi:lysophospholipase L1-like esterase
MRVPHTFCIWNVWEFRSSVFSFAADCYVRAMPMKPCVVLLLLPLLAPAPLCQQSLPASVEAVRLLEKYRETQIPLWMSDFGNLARYRDANARLLAPAASQQRVVFMGDSITDSWELAQYFPGKAYVNRGISGQTTPQMLLRFRSDVLALQPRVVVILAGTNDIAGNTGPMTLDEIEANLETMAELAKFHGIRVVLSSVTPVSDYTENSKVSFPLRPPDEIVALNANIKGYCARSGCVYLDYFNALVDEKGLLKPDLSPDGLHPNARGYAVMAPLAERAIAQALGSSPPSE